MAKLTLNDIPSGFFSNTAYNTNNGLIEAALENTLSRDGTTPNQMESNLDMNSFRVVNLAEPINANEAARLQDIQNAVSGVTSANLLSFTPYGNITSNTVQGAIQEEIDDLAASSGSSLVGFIQSGAGAVARALQSKVRERVSVFDFMTAAQIADVQAETCTLDVTASIQAAIDSGAKEIDFPHGTYKITDQIHIYQKNYIHLIGHGGMIWYKGTYVAGRAGLKIEVSSYCVISNMHITGRPVGATDIITDVPNSLLDYGIYITSEGNHPITQYNTIRNVRVQYCRVAAYQIGHITTNADVNIDGNSILDSFAAFAGIGVRVHCSNTNMTRIKGGAIASNTVAGIQIGLYARGVEISSVLAYNNGLAFIHIKKENSGPISIRDIVTELYEGTWLTVDVVAAGLTNTNLITIENVNVTNNDDTVGQKLIDYQGGGSVIIRNSRFAGAGSLRADSVGATLAFQPPNAAIGGTQNLITENVELSDGATWNVETRNASAWMRWSDRHTTLRATGVSAGEGALSTPIIREKGKINREIERILPVAPITGVTINSVGLLGRTVFKFTIAKEAWIANALSQDIDALTIPAKCNIVACYTDTTAAFAGTGLTGTIQFKVSSSASGSIIQAHDVKTAPVVKGLLDADLGVDLAKATNIQGGFMPGWTSNGRAYCVLTSSVGNLGNGTTTNLTSGSVTVYIITETLPQY